MQIPADEYHSYYEAYIGRMQGRDLLAEIEAQPTKLREDLAGVDGGHRYEEGKWSIEQVLGHVLDIEWVICNRVLRLSRGDETPLPGVDHEVFMRNIDYTGQLNNLLDQLEALRRANLLLFRSLDEKALSRRGIASDMPFSVRALIAFLAGHAEHHFSVVRERYL